MHSLSKKRNKKKNPSKNKQTKNPKTLCIVSLLVSDSRNYGVHMNVQGNITPLNTYQCIFGAECIPQPKGIISAIGNQVQPIRTKTKTVHTLFMCCNTCKIRERGREGERKRGCD